MKTVKIKIDGMKCSHCVATVRDALNRLDGVSDVDVSLSDGLAVVVAEDEVSTTYLTAAVDEQGFDTKIVE